MIINTNTNTNTNNKIKINTEMYATSAYPFS
jgi:hypothetical protein